MHHFFLKGSLTFIIAASSTFLFAQQQKIDSIKSALHTQKGSDRVKSLNELSWYYKNINVDSAFLFSRQSVAEARKLNDKKVVLSSYTALANVFDGVGKLDSSAYFHNKALQIGLELNDSSNMAASYNNLGIVYDLQGANEKSLKMYFDALAIYEAMEKDPYSIAMVLGNIGIVYKKLKQYEKVLMYYQRALDIYIKERSDFGIMVTQGNIGALLINLKRYEEAITMSKKSLAGYQKAGYGRYIPYIEHNLAVAYDSLGNYSIARNYYNASIEKHEKNQNYNEVAVVCNSYSDFLYRNRKYEEGLVVAKKAYANAVKAKAGELRIDALRYMARHNAALKNYQEAYRFHEAFSSLKDSLLSVNNSKQILELQTKYETEQKERKLLAQHIELRNNKDAIRLQILIITFLLLLIIFIYWRFRVRRRQHQIKAQLAINQERNRIAMDLHDHVGAELTLVSSKLDTRTFKMERVSEKEDLEAISNQIRNVNKLLKETVWSIREESIQINQLLDKVRDFAEKQIENTEIVFECSSNDNDFELTPQIALTLYRVGQEGITNTVKYANAKRIDLKISITYNLLIMNLLDDGNGFLKDEVTNGFGLQNMDQRVNQIAGTFAISSSIGSGTTIKIEIPI